MLDTTIRTGQIERSADTNTSLVNDETKEPTTMNQTTTIPQTSRRHVLLVALFSVTAAIAIVIAAYGGPRVDASTTWPGSAVAIGDRWYAEARNRLVQRDSWYLEAKTQPLTRDQWYLEATAQPVARDRWYLEMNRLRDLNEAAAPSVNAKSNAREAEYAMNRLLELNTMDNPMLSALPPTRDAGQRTGPF